MINKKFFWLHIKKSAGTSIKKTLAPYYKEIDNIRRPLPFVCYPKEYWNALLNNYRIPLHQYDFKRMLFAKNFLYSDEEFQNMFKFVIVRNPYNRVVSLWFHVNSMNQKLRKFNKIIGMNKFSFELFIKNYYENYFLRNDICEKRNFVTHSAPMYEDLTDEKGQLLVDYIGKLENIDEAMQNICKKLNIENLSLKKENVLRKNDEYRKYYNKYTRKIITNLYKKDLDFFEYEF